MKIQVVGLGYIGLPILLSFSETNFNVIGMDIDINLLTNLKNGKCDSLEPNLKEIYINNYKNIELTNKIISSDMYIVTVPTPFTNKADISYVVDAVSNILKVYKSNQIIVIESTLPPFAMDKLCDLIESEFGTDYKLAYCPESILPGNILNEIKNNSRIVGTNKKNVADEVIEIYNKVNVNGVFKKTSFIEAELYKLFQNAHRDLEIAFANEVSMICNDLDINSYDLIDHMNKHPRTNILRPSIGVGGHCIAVDPYFLIDEFDSKLMKVARDTNIRKTDYVIRKIKKLGKHCKIGLLGMSYKPNSDDLRESPSVIIYNDLKSEGYHVYACDPLTNKSTIFENHSLEFILDNCEKIVILQEHDIFVDVKKDKKFIDYNIIPRHYNVNSNKHS